MPRRKTTTNHESRITHHEPPMPLTTRDGIKVYCAHHELVDPVTLVPHPRNPNRHPDRQLEVFGRILRANGIRRAVAISTRSGYIVKGHGLVQAALRMGLTEIPVERQHYDTEAAEHQDMVADNRLHELAECDRQTLHAILQDLQEQQEDIELTGFSDDELNRLTNQLAMDLQGDTEKPQVPFSEEIGERQDYVVLVFRHEVDWLAAQEHFDLQTVCSRRSNGKPHSHGIGRVVDGGAHLKRIRHHGDANHGD